MYGSMDGCIMEGWMYAERLDRWMLAGWMDAWKNRRGRIDGL